MKRDQLKQSVTTFCVLLLWGQSFQADTSSSRAGAAPPASSPAPAAAAMPSSGSFVWTRTNLPPLPEYVCQRTVDTITIDGRLTETSWRRARSTPNFFVFNEAPSRTYQTYAKLLWDDNHLYIAFNCADPDVRATRKIRDDDIFNEDCVEFFMMEQYYGAKHNHFLEYEVNPYGTRFDAYNLGVFQGLLDWDSRGWRSAVRVNGTLNNRSDTDRGWTVEMAIPFRDFYATVFLNEERAKQNNGWTKPWRPTAGDRWRFNLYRLKYTATGPRYWAWSPTHLYPNMGFHEIGRFGNLLFSMDAAGGKVK